MGIWNVREQGATGERGQDAREAIQKAIDACARAGGGMVYLPPGEYTSGTLHLKSNVRFHLEAGATLYASREARGYTWQDHRASLFYGEGLERVTLEGRGVVDGQAAYEWRLSDHDDRYILYHQRSMEALGKPLMRPFPVGEIAPRMVLLLRCRDVRIEGLSFVGSPSWTINPYGCERLMIDGVYIASSLRDGVWADGIDPDGCRDVRIANCTIETGDDAIVFYSSDVWGPALPCEKITVTNCRLSSASSALKFCDGNKNCVRDVTVDNCVISDSNRGIAFMTFDGGDVSDVVLANLVIDCRRYDWYWWGDGDPIHFMVRRRIEELHPELLADDAEAATLRATAAPVERGVTSSATFVKEPPAGAIRNVTIANVIARGCGTSLIQGRPDSPIEGLRLQGVRLHVDADPGAPFEPGGPALHVRHARDLALRDVEVTWGDLCAGEWESALVVEAAQGLLIDGFRGRSAAPGRPALDLRGVEDAVIRNCRS